MVGDQRIKSCNQAQNKGADPMGAQRGDKIADAAGKQTHLEEGIE